MQQSRIPNSIVSYRIRVLTKVLLKKDFGLEWDIPDSHLTPGLTGRINYLNWIHEVLQLVPDASETPSNNQSGIDVGTGASCIYPLLGHALYGWTFDATDIDNESVISSEHLVTLNKLDHAIQIHQRTPSQPLLTDLVATPVSFSMCNPPFFSSMEEVCICKTLFVISLLFLRSKEILELIVRQLQMN